MLDNPSEAYRLPRAMSGMNQNDLHQPISDRQLAAEHLAIMACSTCPLTKDCGIGYDNLPSELGGRETRRRFVRRVRVRLPEGRINVANCATSLAPGRQPGLFTSIK